MKAKLKWENTQKGEQEDYLMAEIKTKPNQTKIQ